MGGTVLMQWHGMVTCLWQLQMLGMPWLPECGLYYCLLVNGAIVRIMLPAARRSRTGAEVTA